MIPQTTVLNESQYPFLSDFRVFAVAEGTTVNEYKLAEDFIVFSETLKARVVVPAGFDFDGESIPLWLVGLAHPMGECRRGACVHDYLYRYSGYKNAAGHFVPVTRAQADAVYYELILAKGTPKWRATIRWALLRAVGFFAWQGNKGTHGAIPLALLSLIAASCTGADRQTVFQNAIKDELAAGEGYLLGGNAGALAMASRQELRNIQEWQKNKCLVVVPK